MTRSNPIQASFNAGELSPRLHARLDFSKYENGVETMVNMLPLAEGGAIRRSGSRYVGAVKTATVAGRLKRFQFSTTQAYQVEMGASVFRFYRHQGSISVADTDASVSNGTFTGNITGWDDRSTGGAGNQIAHDATNNRLTLTPNGTAADDIGWAEQDITTTATGTEHVVKFRVIGAPGNKIDVQVGSTSTGSENLSPVECEVGYHSIAFTPSASPFYLQFLNRGADQNKNVQIDNVSLLDNQVVEIDTPYPEADLFTVNGPQSADVLYLFHPSYPTYKLQRLGHTTWQLVEVAWTDGPYLTENTTATTLTPSANTGLGINLTLSSVQGVNGDTGWQSTDIGRLVRYKKSADWGSAVIVSITSTTVAVADVRENFEATPTAVTTWRLGAWSGTTGYPSCGAFYQQRLLAANTSEQPQTWWASQTSDFENMAPDNQTDGKVADDDALQYTISADDVDAIRWLSPGRGTMVIGTVGGEWVVSSSSSSAVITPTDVVVEPSTTHGSANIAPLRVGNVVLFAQRALRKIREFGFDFAVDGYQAFDMTRLAEHISRGGITEMDYAEEPNAIVWCVRGDGQLLSMTYRREEDVVGWSRHVIGGSFDTTFTQVWQVDVSGPTYVDETTDANDTDNADWTLFPASEAVGDYAAFGFKEKFRKITFDYANGTAGVGGVVAWEYWNGNNWQALPNVTDNTTGFTATAADGLKVTWDWPSDWRKVAINTSTKLYYVRARITTVYTTNPILDQGYIAGPAVVESISVIPGAAGAGQTQSSVNRDEVWVLVKRTINGATARYIEVLEADWDESYDHEDAYYSDSVITYDGSAATSITGLSHLEGETVKVLADGYIVADAVVASGAITLAAAASVVQIGLGYRHTLKPLKLVSGTPLGTPMGKTKQIFGVTFVLLNAHTLTFGPDDASLRTVDFRTVEDTMDNAVPYFTGEYFVEWDDDWNADPRMVIESDDPAPFGLLALAPEVDTAESRS